MNAQAVGCGMLFVVGALLASGCGAGGSSPVPVIGGGAAEDSSELTAINVGLPDRGPLKTKVPDIETKMNGYHLIVGPSDPGCAGTKVDEVGDYAASPSLSASLKQGCDYDVILALGNKGGSSAQPAQVTWEGKVKSYIDASCAGCHGAGRTPPELTSYEKVKAAGDKVEAAVSGGTMPKGSSASAEDKSMIKAWKDGGYLEKSSASGSAVAGKLAAAYYKNNQVHKIPKSEIAGKATYRFKLPLQLQPDGQAIGLSTADGSSTQPPAGGAQPPVITQPTQTISLPADRDFQVTDQRGATKKLSEVFKGKYILLDFSASNCGYCLTRARELNQDENLKSLLNGEKCSHATVVPKDDLSAWHSATGGASTFVGTHSYAATTTRLNGLVTAFGVSFAGTPTFILVDSAGKAVADENAIPTSAINQYCK